MLTVEQVRECCVRKFAGMIYERGGSEKGEDWKKAEKMIDRNWGELKEVLPFYFPEGVKDKEHFETRFGKYLFERFGEWN